MKVVGCDVHTRYQQSAMQDNEVRPADRCRLKPTNGEARDFYRELRPSAITAPNPVQKWASGSSNLMFAKSTSC